MSEGSEAPRSEAFKYGQLSPFLYVSGQNFPYKTAKAASEVLMRWSRRYPCAAWWSISGDFRRDGPISMGLEFLPDDEAMAELRGELEPLLGPIVFWGMQWDLATGRAKGKPVTGNQTFSTLRKCPALLRRGIFLVVIPSAMPETEKLQLCKAVPSTLSQCTVRGSTEGAI